MTTIATIYHTSIVLHNYNRYNTLPGANIEWKVNIPQKMFPHMHMGWSPSRGKEHKYL